MLRYAVDAEMKPLNTSAADDFEIQGHVDIWLAADYIQIHF